MCRSWLLFSAAKKKETCAESQHRLMEHSQILVESILFLYFCPNNNSCNKNTKS